jgi:hypothetical protein
MSPWRPARMPVTRSRRAWGAPPYSGEGMTMAQGWRKRMAVIGAGVMLSSGLIGCMNDKKTVGPPPVSKGSTASTATSGSTPGSTPTWATQTPGSTTPGAAPGAASAQNWSQSVNQPFGATPTRPSDPLNNSYIANPNNTGRMGSPSPQGVSGLGSPMPAGMSAYPQSTQPGSGGPTSSLSPGQQYTAGPSTARAAAPGMMNPTPPRSDPPVTELAGFPAPPSAPPYPSALPAGTPTLGPTPNGPIAPTLPSSVN